MSVFWHGWSQDKEKGKALFIGPLPNRKRLTLYEQEENIITVLAFFETEEAARKVSDWIDLFTGVNA